MLKIALLILFGSTPAMAIDPACTLTTNLSMNYCPSGSTDWYQSYTDIVNNLDALAKTAPSSFTVVGTSGLKVVGPTLIQGALSVNGQSSPGSINMTSSSSTITNTSSMTAAAFFGDGSHLTGISGTLSGGSTGYGPRWTSSTSLGSGPFVETTSSATLLSGTTIHLNTLAQFTNNGIQSGGDPAAGQINASGGVISYWAKSLDGVSESSGCAVRFGVNDFAGGAKGDPATLVFTSTTTASAGTVGVLLETCAPLSICRVAIMGIVRVQCSSFTLPNPIELNGTRCQAQTNNPSSSTSGEALSTCSGNWGWARLVGH